MRPGDRDAAVARRALARRMVVPRIAVAGIVVVLDRNRAGMPVEIAEAIGEVRIPWLLLAAVRVMKQGDVAIPFRRRGIAASERGRALVGLHGTRLQVGIAGR